MFYMCECERACSAMVSLLVAAAIRLGSILHHHTSIGCLVAHLPVLRSHGNCPRLPHLCVLGDILLRPCFDGPYLFLIQCPRLFRHPLVEYWSGDGSDMKRLVGFLVNLFDLLPTATGHDIPFWDIFAKHFFVYCRFICDPRNKLLCVFLHRLKSRVAIQVWVIGPAKL
jgi:hypothetical protein